MSGRSDLISSISVQNCRRDSGSIPVVGSSRISRSGSWIREQQSDSFCFIPPESLPAGRSRKGMQPGGAQQALDADATLSLCQAEQPAEEIDVLEHRQGRIEVAAQPLRHIGDARRDGVAMPARSDIAPERADRAGLQAPDARDQGEQCRLADPVGSDECGCGARQDRKRGIVDGRHGAIAMGDAVDLDDRLLTLEHRVNESPDGRARPRRTRPGRRRWPSGPP